MAKYDFGSGGLRVNGVPIQGNSIPVGFGDLANQGFGKVFYVHPSLGSDNNKGTSADKPLKTIAKADTLTTSNQHDVVVLSAASSHTLTSMLSISKNRVHYVGLDGTYRRYGQRCKVSLGVTTAATDIGTIQNTGVGNTFANIKFMNSNTVAQGIYCFVEAGEYTVIENCEIYKSTDLNVTGAAELVMNGDSSVVRGCTIGSNVNAIVGAIIRPCILFTRGIVSGKAARDVTIEDTLFWRNCGNSANRFMYGANANDIERMCLIKDCVLFNTKLAAGTPAQSIAFGAAQTQGYVLCQNVTSVGSATALSTTTGVFTADTTPDATGAAASIAIQCA
jgi:hypothetical protein